MVSLGFIKKFLLGAILLRTSCALPVEVEEWIASNPDGNGTIEERGSHSFMAVWATEQIAYTGGGPAAPGGDYIYSGFTLYNAIGKTIWHAEYPGDHAACYGANGCRYFTLKTPCFAGLDFKFRCAAGFVDPKLCGVKDVAGKTLAVGHSNTKVNFYGAFLTSKSLCAATFAVPTNVVCEPNQPMTLIESSRGPANCGL